MLKSKKDLGGKIDFQTGDGINHRTSQIAGVAGASVERKQVWLKLDMAPEAPQIPIPPPLFSQVGFSFLKTNDR